MQRQGKQKWTDRLEKGVKSLCKDLDAVNTTEDVCIRAAETMVYTGIYPRHELMAARKTLVMSIQCQKSSFWKLLKNKLGIFEDGSWLASRSPVNHPSSFYPGVSQQKMEENNQHSEVSIREKCAVSVTIGQEEMNQSFSDATCENRTARVTVGHEKQEMTRGISNCTEDRISAERAPTKESPIPFSFIIDRVGQSMPMLPATNLNENDTVMQPFVRENQHSATPSIKLNESIKVDQTGFRDRENKKCCEKNSELETKECYKCDLCTFISCEAEMTLEHLREKLHYSASKVLATAAGDKLVPKEIITVMIFKHQPALYKNLVPLCPACNLCFPNIYACSQHYVQVHALSGDQFYGLGQVRLETNIYRDINDFRCSLCTYQASRLSQWNKHMQSHKELEHERPRKDEIMICFCPYCSLGPSDYHGCLSHIICKHKKGKTEFMIKAAFIKKSITHHQMLPLRLEANSKPEDAVQRELSLVKAIKKASNSKSKTDRRVCKMLNRQIKDLKILVK
ncbi:hypothetical protein CHS0354_032500 [Potamilus streckersoni]|uniref:C2H2-type domain-containing protein n=1 Tax=Potamilus streckersoni TaxID=2493646 RepID=A0AAE0SPZ0_9BIVA|nr:hypothetical protein CHS0354_032500 [Potamilus streckersoni]